MMIINADKYIFGTDSLHSAGANKRFERHNDQLALTFLGSGLGQLKNGVYVAKYQGALSTNEDKISKNKVKDKVKDGNVSNVFGTNGGAWSEKTDYNILYLVCDNTDNKDNKQ